MTLVQLATFVLVNSFARVVKIITCTISLSCVLVRDCCPRTVELYYHYTAKPLLYLRTYRSPTGEELLNCIEQLCELHFTNRKLSLQAREEQLFFFFLRENITGTLISMNEFVYIQTAKFILVVVMKVHNTIIWWQAIWQTLWVNNWSTLSTRLCVRHKDFWNFFRESCSSKGIRESDWMTLFCPPAIDGR
jgi:hypothetical protein